MIILKRNKRGDVPITILVIGIFALCSLALFTFLISDIQTSNSFVGVSKLAELNLKINQYHFLNSNGVSFEKISEVTGILKDGDEKYIYLEKRDTWNKDRFIFSVNYTFPN